MEDNVIESVIILGDYNSHPDATFYYELSRFCADLQWVCADVGILGLDSSTYTYVCDVGGSKMWLDHCLAIKSA